MDFTFRHFDISKIQRPYTHAHTHTGLGELYIDRIAACMWYFFGPVFMPLNLLTPQCSGLAEDENANISFPLPTALSAALAKVSHFSGCVCRVAETSVRIEKNMAIKIME